MSLPILPDHAGDVTHEIATDLERNVAGTVARIDDFDTAWEWHAQAAALAAYLEHTDSHLPMLGALRRIEARIGQLLGKAPGRGRKEMNYHGNSFPSKLRAEFRLLASAVDEGLLDYRENGDDSAWRATRRALVLAARLRDLSGVKGSVTVEWHTPAEYIEAARDVLGGIDLDPASNPLANETVQATRFYTEEDDGLTQDWHGRVWLNPPYGKGTGLFATKLVAEHAASRVTAAILLINAYGFDASWFRPLWDHPLCFTDHRIVFTSPQRGTGGPANGNLFVYLGPQPDQFISRFSEFGAIVRRIA